MVLQQCFRVYPEIIEVVSKIYFKDVSMVFKERCMDISWMFQYTIMFLGCFETFVFNYQEFKQFLLLVLTWKFTLNFSGFLRLMNQEFAKPGTTPVYQSWGVGRWLTTNLTTWNSLGRSWHWESYMM